MLSDSMPPAGAFQIKRFAALCSPEYRAAHGRARCRASRGALVPANEFYVEDGCSYLPRQRMRYAIGVQVQERARQCLLDPLLNNAID